MNVFPRQKQRCRDREWTCGHRGGRQGQDELGDYDWHIYTATCEIDSKWEAVTLHSKLSSVLCNDLEEWDGGGWEGGPEGRGFMYAYV